MIRVDEKTHSWLKETAQREGRSISEIVEILRGTKGNIKILEFEEGELEKLNMLIRYAYLTNHIKEESFAAFFKFATDLAFSYLKNYELKRRGIE